MYSVGYLRIIETIELCNNKFEQWLLFQLILMIKLKFDVSVVRV